MNRRGWLGALAANRLAPALLSLSLAIALAGVVVAANRAGDVTRAPLAIDGGAVASPSVPAAVGPTTGTSGDAATRPTPGAGLSSPTAGSAVPPGTPSAPPEIRANRPTAPVTTRCRPVAPQTANGRPETGITDEVVRIGQIVTDSSNLPAQLRPNYEGLLAYVKKVNDAGGVCGRRIEVVYDNDNSFPATHRFEQMAQSVFAFVANSSLIDGQDYEDRPPFNPRYRDNRTGEYVPDVGGLAYSYGRNQSRWFAGVIGSLSPVLYWEDVFKRMLAIDRAQGRTCSKAGLVYLVEPTGVSNDQVQLGRASLAEKWGAGLGYENVRLYEASLAQPVQVYRGTVQAMIRDGVNCAFTFADLTSNVNLVVAMAQEGVWPPGRCTRADRRQCFGVFYMPFAGYDPKFIRDVESQAAGASRYVTTFLPHVPLNETGDPAMRTYLHDLRRCREDARYPGCNDAEPSTFSIIGYASGVMFVEALRACGAAPTRRCVMEHLRLLRSFTGAGLLGPITPFQSTRARDDSGHGYGVWNWRWIFPRWVMLRVQGTESDLIARFHRIHPAQGFADDRLHVARGARV